MSQHTPYFLEPMARNAKRRFYDFYDDWGSTTPVINCAFPSCGEHHLYADTPVCITHAETIWKLFEDREPDLHKRVVREQFKEEQARLAAMHEQSEDQRRIDSYSPGHIYYLQIGDRIKIGFTADLDQRLNQYPPNAELLADHPGTKAMEKDMHKRFDMYRTEGREWFSASNAILAHVEEVKAKYPRSVAPRRMRKANGRKSAMKARTLARRV